jgi:hypothetical protein
MITLCVSIGNTDNKLTQHEWAKFVRAVGELLQCYQTIRYFFGGSATYEPWQNVCWLVQVNDAQLSEIKVSISSLRELYGQDSAYVLWGMGEFI